MAQEKDQIPRRPDLKSERVSSSPNIPEKADVHKIDDLLDEIDSVLEENAEEFVKNYVQKGGQ
ncbi:MAG: ubiquitin-like protein Pup [Acidimicrobiia bacterium]|nr:ubiquitin-like protein Pup [bacterium]MXX64746.1 ubiquitin-like protein Pup [Acidimicrobiia bacterium]MCY3579707.1 ubiquitin-like protein Pup [bacterium]MCY3652531.1 ubiquitin-like protein Pup [bacterium]MDE0643898.1 ubiquitin-like protein Pup [bacterium]